MVDEVSTAKGEAGAQPSASASSPQRQAAAGDSAQLPNPASGARANDKPAATQAGAQRPAGADKSIGNSAMSLDSVRNIPVTLTVVLGSVSIPVSELMEMQRGNTIALAKKVGEPVDILANGKLIARGEIVVVEEDEPVFAVSLTELVASGGAKAP